MHQQSTHFVIVWLPWVQYLSRSCCCLWSSLSAQSCWHWTLCSLPQRRETQRLGTLCAVAGADGAEESNGEFGFGKPPSHDAALSAPSQSWTLKRKQKETCFPLLTPVCSFWAQCLRNHISEYWIFTEQSLPQLLKWTPKLCPWANPFNLPKSTYLSVGVHTHTHFHPLARKPFHSPMQFLTHLPTLAFSITFKLLLLSKALYYSQHTLAYYLISSRLPFCFPWISCDNLISAFLSTQSRPLYLEQFFPSKSCRLIFQIPPLMARILIIH